MEKKTCFICLQEKNLDKFSNYVHKRNGKKYYKNSCMACKNRKKLLNRYGLKPDDYNKMLSKQDNKCAICGIDKSYHINSKSANNNFDVDHCHTTGKVRGLLCNRCNKAIGYFKDDINLIEKALIYLKE